MILSVTQGRASGELDRASLLWEELMSLTMHLFEQNQNPTIRSEDITSLVVQLGDDDGLLRRKARESLVNLDGSAVPSLVKALSNPSRDVRWEAAKALGELGDASAAPALVQALEDERFGVRWLAAEALIALGPEAVLPPLMHALSESADSIWLRQGAHHVLRARARIGLPEKVQPVLAALEDVEPAMECPTLALNAWKSLRPS
jgi:HEAT repeat protein